MTIQNQKENHRRAGRPREFNRKEALEKALKIFWSYGYEPTPVSLLCSEMGIKPPSFYAAFGNKESLFIEAINYYEQTYWQEPLRRLEASHLPIREALNVFFKEAADILLNPANPSGCMVVLAAVNISPKEERIASLVKKLRLETGNFFFRRLKRAQKDGEVEGDITAMADALNILLEGMSIQAKDGLSLEALYRASLFASRILGPNPQRTGSTESK